MGKAHQTPPRTTNRAPRAVTKRQVLAGAGALVVATLLYQAACMAIPPDWFARTVVSDVGFVVVELVVLALTLAAYRRVRESPDRVLWLWVAGWVALNAFGDIAWAYYELGRRVEPPSLGVADLGYLLAYLAAFSAVVVLARRLGGGLRALETGLDAMMFTIGAAALAWPLALSQLLSDAGSGAAYWVTLAYPVGDLLVLLAFVSFFFTYAGSGRGIPAGYLIAVCVAFSSQIVADGAYFTLTARGADYGPGSWLDMIWLLSFSTAGVAGLMAMRAAGLPRPREETGGLRNRYSVGTAAGVGHIRLLMPYLALPVIGGMIIVELERNSWRWDRDGQVIAYLGFALVALLVCRQYVVLAQNRRLNKRLTLVSTQLRDRVGDLAELNERLNVLNEHFRRMSTLKEVRAVAESGLQLVCTFSRCLGGWVSLNDAGGNSTVVATTGSVDEHRPGDSELNTLEETRGTLWAVPLEVRGDTLGTIWLIQPDAGAQQLEMLPVIAAHVAIALENTRSYEEVLHLAEKDPLTGLYNHRGIHKRLAGECIRAQQNAQELSLVMLDMDGFKLLNDTYGHPAGDSVLRHVSNAIHSGLRHADLAGRVGGDEMLIVLPNTGAEGATQFCERLIEALAANPCRTGQGVSLPVHVSLGLATLPGDAQSLADLIELADANLYTSKERGGNMVTASTPPGEDPVESWDALGVAGKLLNVVGARDNYTLRHSEQVALYALLLGESLGLSDESLGTLHVAALLHDVGKIGVSESLLNRPSSLSPAEEDMVRRHAEMSAAVIRDMPRLARVADAVEAHHEHLDGSGYPNEIAGDDIPLLARILAVADAYSAMTLDRPYRRSHNHEQARIELLKAAGARLDPDLVRRFLEILDARLPGSVTVRAQAG